MPLVKIHVLKGRPPNEVDVLLDTIHDVVVQSFGVPTRDRYQILQEHEASHLRALDTGLNIQRTEKFVVLEITSRPGRANPRWHSIQTLRSRSRTAATSRHQT